MLHPLLASIGTLDAEAAKASVLVVDDESGTRELLCRWLSNSGFDVSSASTADEALRSVHALAPAVALCDIRMPGHDGLWLAQQIRQDAPETAVIMATGVHDVGSAVSSLRQGVIEYLTKPFGRDRLREAVVRGLEWHRAACEARRWREALEADMESRRRRLAGALSALVIDSDAALDAMLSMLTIGDRDAYGHAYRVAALAASMARALQLPEHERIAIERAALLHDLGKLAVPDAVLRKPAPLTPEEQLLVRLHPVIGADLIRGIPYLAASADLVRDAHERMDGLGYPHGLRATEVPVGARIIAVADAYDAMTRPRVFRDAISHDEALLELSRCAGAQFDGRVIETFKKLLTL
jgi:response regulator RpfG family c-di-GMP phosphodiesterase